MNIPIQHRNRFVIFVAVFAVTMLASGGVWFIKSGPIPYSYRAGLHYTLYYPTQLPDGYRVDRNSFLRKGSVLIFSLVSPHSKAIAVSEEALPVGLNLSPPTAPYIQLQMQRSFTTAIGPATLSLWGANDVVSIQASGTWLILNVTGVKPQTAIKVGSHFSPI